MTPTVGPTSYVSRLSVGWLEDIGYQVNYAAADAYDKNNLGTNPSGNCRCNRRRQVRHLAYIGPDGKPFEDFDRRELSDEGFDAAVAYGLAYLDEQKFEHDMASFASGEAEDMQGLEQAVFVGDQATSVIYIEDGNVHSVIVRREG